MEFTFSDNGLEKKDLLLLDLLTTAHWERPIYFNPSVVYNLGIDIRPHVVMEGLALRLLPIQNWRKKELINTTVTYEHFMHHFSWRGLDRPGTYYDENYRMVFIRQYRMAFCMLAQALLQEGKKNQAREVLLHSLKVMPDKVVAYDLANIYMLQLLFEIEEAATALHIAKKVGKRIAAILMYQLNHFTNIEACTKENIAILEEVIRSLRRGGEIALAEKYEQLYRTLPPQLVQKHG